MNPYLPAILATGAIVLAVVGASIAESARRAWQAEARRLESARAELDLQLDLQLERQEQKFEALQQRLAGSEARNDALSARVQTAETRAITAGGKAHDCAALLQKARATIDALLDEKRECPHCTSKTLHT